MVINVAKLNIQGLAAEPFRQRLMESSIHLAKPLSDGVSCKIQVNETWRAQAPAALAEAISQAAS